MRTEQFSDGCFIFDESILTPGWDTMSESTQSGSVSCQDLFRRMKMPQTSGNVPSSGTSAGVPMEACVYSVGKRELGKDGFEKYSIDDGVEVYFSKVPESVMFNDGEPVTIRAQPDVMVGLCRPRSNVDVRVKEIQSMSSLSVEDLFSNITRGEDQVIDTKVGAYKNGVFMNPKVLSHMNL